MRTKNIPILTLATVLLLSPPHKALTQETPDEPQKKESPPPEKAPLAPLSINSYLLSDTLWSSPPEETFSPLKPYDLIWTSDAETTLRTTHKKLTFLDQRLYELIIATENKNTSAITISIFNKGDARRQFSEYDFTKLAENSIKKIQTLVSVPEEVIFSPPKSQSKMSVEHKIWRTPTSVFHLRWAFNDAYNGIFSPEYIQLRVFPNQNQDVQQILSEREIEINIFKLKERLIKKDDGTLLLPGIPMVDQGSKGYCVAASAERLLRYYGTDIDQHEMAQWANTSRYGTKLDDFSRALKSMGRIFKFELNILDHISPEDFQREFNIRARSASGRSKNPLRVERFAKTIEKSLTEGHPILWTVLLGIVEEKPELPQSFGGHMRIISGINPAKREIIYSDSWGRGHEYKSMKFEDAYSITTALLTLDVN